MKRRIHLLLAMTAIMLFGIVQTAAAANPTAYSGRGTVVSATILSIPVALGDTGPLPSGGGALNEALLDLDLPIGGLGALGADVSHATAIAQGSFSRSEAVLTAVDLDLSGLGLGVSADLIVAFAEARCNRGKPGVSGSSSILNLAINGEPVVVTGKPNQTIQLPLGLGQIIINEQTTSGSGRTRSIVVNALHVQVTGIADIVLGHAEAGITCGKLGHCPASDKISAAGIMELSGGGKANFAVVGGVRNGNPFGHLRFNDNDGTKVQSTGVTNYEVTGANSRRITGTAKVNGAGGFTFIVDVTDNGKPQDDRIRVRLSNGYDTGMMGLAGRSARTCGNIRLHKACK